MGSQTSILQNHEKYTPVIHPPVSASTIPAAPSDPDIHQKGFLRTTDSTEGKKNHAA